MFTLLSGIVAAEKSNVLIVGKHINPCKLWELGDSYICEVNSYVIRILANILSLSRFYVSRFSG